MVSNEKSVFILYSTIATILAIATSFSINPFIYFISYSIYFVVYRMLCGASDVYGTKEYIAKLIFAPFVVVGIPAIAVGAIALFIGQGWAILAGITLLLSVYKIVNY
ncbi:MAG: hypothetical protein ACRCXZ_05290 [Patescibacteria group bacterium]